MSESSSRNVSYLSFIAFLSVFAYMLIEIMAQYAFPATYNAQFTRLKPHEVTEIEAAAQTWKNGSRSAEIRISKGKAEGTKGYVDLKISINLIEQGFSTLARFVSNGELGSYGGNLSFSREPNPLGQKFALLGSILLFLLLLKPLIGGRPEDQDTHDSPS